MKILILNPPSQQDHLRGNYCSNVSKGVYYYPAIDLLVQSGILHQAFEIHVIDAIAERKTAAEVLAFVHEEKFDGVYAVTGSSSRSDDFHFFEMLKLKNPNLRILLSGGYLLTEHAAILEEHRWLDGVLLDWTSHESIDFFHGKQVAYQWIATKDHKPGYSKSTKEKLTAYPPPRHEKFPLEKYNHPQAVSQPLSVIIQSTGCPYQCSYCIYSITPYRYRPLENLMEEIKYTLSVGIKELFFHDPTFALNRDYTLSFCKEMQKLERVPGWFCQSRVDLMDEHLLAEMKKSGCHGIMFGVETANEDLLKEHDRRIKHQQTIDTFAHCKKLGIRTLSYLVIGLPGDTRDSILQTASFVQKIKSDFVSFNLAIPVIGTKFREDSIAEGLAQDNMVEFDNSSDNPAMATRYLSKDELFVLHKKIIRDFYARPSYLIERLLSIRSFYEFKNHFREGYSMFSKLFS